jgi:hypothetical protein
MSEHQLKFIKFRAAAYAALAVAAYILRSMAC